MTKEEAINKAIELEFGVGNAKSIREHNSSLVKVAEHLYDLLQPSTPPDFDTEVYNWLKQHGSDETRQLIEMTARHFWEMAQVGGAMLHIADKSYKMGRRDERFEMMKDAVEYEVYDFSSNEPHPHISVDTPGHITGEKVKVIVLKEEDEQ